MREVASVYFKLGSIVVFDLVGYIISSDSKTSSSRGALSRSTSSEFFLVVAGYSCSSICKA